MTASGHIQGAAAPVSSSVTIPVLAFASAPREGAGEPRFFQAHPVLRRIAYVLGYEGLSVFFTAVVMSGMLGHGGGESTLTAVLISTTATAWNYVWNTLYEGIERRTGANGRGALARALHAVGYEGGVLVFTIPIVAIMLGITLVEAVMIEAGLLVFFLVFAVVYAWVFDRVFGLPASAAALPAGSEAR